MEHLERFGLERDPFRSEPQLEFWFPSRVHVAAGRRLRRCVEQGKELCLLLGPVGSGTTTLLRALCEQLDAEQYETCLLMPLRGTGGDELRTMIARQLGIEAPLAERSEAMRQLYTHLVELQASGRRAVLGIDEAHALAPEAFAELRALLQLEHDDARLLCAVLVGTPDLATAITSDDGLPGRVDLQVALTPLDDAEAGAYLSHRIEVAGGDPDLIEGDVAEAIALRAAGLPRRLNALADAALFEAHLADHDRPDVADVERAAHDLPWAQVDSPAAASMVDDGLDGSLDAEPIESLAHAESNGFADLDLPEDGPELEGDVARDIERALGTDEPGPARFALDRTMREPDFEDALESNSTAPGVWQSPSPMEDGDDDITASRVARAEKKPDLPPVPSEDELDDLFVDLVDEVEPDA